MSAGAGALDIAEIKARLSVPEAWRLLGVPGEAQRCGPSPFRPDQHPSFSVYADGQRWKDQATGEGGDVLDFVAAVLDCDTAGALKWTREALGNGAVPASIRPQAIGRMDGRTDGPPKKLPPLRLARAGELETLAQLRGFRVPVLETAQAAGLLRFIDAGRTWGAVSWAATCPAGRIVEARRLDGKPYSERRWPDRETGETRTLPERKCHAFAVTSCVKAWPVNLEVAARCRAIALTEGAPDLLAALHFIERERAEGVGVAGMLGGANRIAADCLTLFYGKRVRIFAHDDLAGYEAARRWTRQLREAGAEVDGFSVATLERHDGQRGKDLCDLLRIGPDSHASFPEYIMP